MDKIERALKWIIEILNRKNIPYHITGGFAAHLYGAKRSINDIDLAVPDNRIAEIFEEVKQYVTYPPGQYQDSTWDIYQMALIYQGQEIDISGKGKIFNKHTKTWDVLIDNLENVNKMKIYGISVAVQNKVDLISYKDKISFDEEKHQEDIVAVKKWKRLPDFLKSMFS